MKPSRKHSQCRDATPAGSLLSGCSSAAAQWPASCRHVGARLLLCRLIHHTTEVGLSPAHEDLPAHCPEVTGDSQAPVQPRTQHQPGGQDDVPGTLQGPHSKHKSCLEMPSVIFTADSAPQQGTKSIGRSTDHKTELHKAAGPAQHHTAGPHISAVHLGRKSSNPCGAVFFPGVQPTLACVNPHLSCPTSQGPGQRCAGGVWAGHSRSSLWGPHGPVQPTAPTSSLWTHTAPARRRSHTSCPWTKGSCSESPADCVVLGGVGTWGRHGEGALRQKTRPADP